MAKKNQIAGKGKAAGRKNKSREKKQQPLKTNIFDNVWFGLLLIVAVAALIYSNTYHCPFVFDDIVSITENEQIRDTGNYLTLNRFFKPRSPVFLTFALNYRFGQLEVFGYHLVNVLIHIVNALLVFFLAKLVFSRLPDKSSLPIIPISLAAALFFSVHPLQTQAVTYTSQRVASMAAMFYLASVLCYLKGRTSGPSPVWFALAGLTGAMAFLCKPNTASLPGAIILVEFVCFDRSWQVWKRKWLWFTAVFFVWIVFMLFVMGSFSSGSGGTDFLNDVSERMRQAKSISRWQYLCTQFNVLIVYLRLFILPVRQHLDYYYVFKYGFFDGYTPLAFLVLVGLIATGVVFRKKHPVVTFAVAWFFVTLSVESSIIPIDDALFEHRMYLAMPGLAMLASYFIGKSLPVKHQWGKLLIYLGIIALLGVGTFARNHAWQSRIQLWTDVVEKAPHNPRGYGNLGLAYSAGGEYDRAIDLYLKAIDLKTDYPAFYSDLGNAYSRKGERQKALAAQEKAVAMSPGDGKFHLNLGKVYSDLKQYDKAISEFERALEINPRHVNAWYNLGVPFDLQGQEKEAVESYEKAIELDPGHVKAHYNIGVIRYDQGDNQTALSYYLKVIELDPEHSGAHNNMAVIYYYGDEFDKAIHHCDKALELGFNVHPQFLELLEPHRK